VVILRSYRSHTRADSRFRRSLFYARGGEPLLLQNPLPERRCPSCQNLMPLLACIGDRNGSEHGFVDNDFVQMLFYFCAPCTVVVSENQTD
jgi:hypothetical protein